jgi:hypothetical protein
MHAPVRGPAKAPRPLSAAKMTPTPAMPALPAELPEPSLSLMRACGRLGQPRTPTTTCLACSQIIRHMTVSYRPFQCLRP